MTQPGWGQLVLKRHLLGDSSENSEDRTGDDTTRTSGEI
jgi:hypothetical protein